jgi:hypothetical protein
VAVLNAKIRIQLAETHSLQLDCASLRSYLDQEKEKSQTLAHEVDKLTVVEGMLTGLIDYLVKTREKMKIYRTRIC